MCPMLTNLSDFTIETRYDDYADNYDGVSMELVCGLCETPIVVSSLLLSDVVEAAEKHECDQMARLVIKARELAREAHKDQRYDGLSYFDGHLQSVVCEMEVIIHNSPELYPSESTLLAAAWLHDVLEDTATTYEQLLQVVGFDVANIVQAVTDEPGVNRKERKAKTLPKIKAYGKLAVAVKLADRLANVKGATLRRKDFLAMYHKEQPEFEAALRTPGELDNAWKDLNWRLPKAKDIAGYYIVVTNLREEFQQWCAHKNLEHPNQALQAYSLDFKVKAFGLSPDHWKVVVLPNSHAEVVKELISLGYKVL